MRQLRALWIRLKGLRNNSKAEAEITARAGTEGIVMPRDLNRDANQRDGKVGKVESEPPKFRVGTDIDEGRRCGSQPGRNSAACDRPPCVQAVTHPCINPGPRLSRAAGGCADVRA